MDMNMNMKEKTLSGFIGELSSSAPTPGGGGASALVGAVGAALCSMAASLTTGKKKFAEYEEDLSRIIKEAKAKSEELLNLIQRDADVFEPLSRAYSIPKGTPGREETLEAALRLACSAPLEMLRCIGEVVELIEELSHKCSKLVISDVAVAAAACRAAMDGAAMNVYINTALMTDREYAAAADAEAEALIARYRAVCDKIYAEIEAQIRGNSE
jgi:formiminotetrahydrofolate cyclodeaminase